MQSLTTLNLTEGGVARLRKPWEVMDEEIAPHLSMEMVFGDLRGLSRDGRYFHAGCPFHEGEEADAFSIDPERLEWICFMGCGGGGPVQYLQKARKITWVEAAQTLAVMAGVDPSKLSLWGQHWTEADFHRHEQLEIRSALLRIFVAYARTLMASAAGRTLRRHLESKYGLSEIDLSELELGLYTNNADVFHYLKRTGQDLSELRGKGLFDPSWSGRLIAPWKDVSGRTVNLWGWDCGGLEGDASLGEVLFERDPLGAQQTPFLLNRALGSGQTDLILMQQPLSALLTLAAGIQDPFPVACMGSLTSEQVDLLDRVLSLEGSLTLLSDYQPESYGTRADTTFRHSKLLDQVNFPVFAVDSRLMNGDTESAVAPHSYLAKKGKEAFLQLIQQAEVIHEPAQKAVRGTVLPNLKNVFKGGGIRSALSRARRESGGEGGALLGLLMSAAEEIGQRIAHGFLRSLPGGRERQAAEAFLESPAQLPPAQKPRLAVFSVDRLDLESRQAALTKTSGFEALDGLGVRFRPEELTIVGGASGHGRTSFLLALLVYWLYRTEETLVFYSFDESEIQIYHRMLCLLTAVAGEGWPIARVRDHLTRGVGEVGDLEEEQLGVLETARECLRGWEHRLHVVFGSKSNMAGIEHHLAEIAGDSGLGAVLIDSANVLLTGSSGQGPVRALKAQAVAHTCPLVATVRTQPPAVNYSARTRDTRTEVGLEYATELWHDAGLNQLVQQSRPTLREFPEGLDQEADLILGLLNYAAVYPSLTRAAIPTESRFEIGVLRNRSGPQGDWITLSFDRNHCLLQDV